MKQVVLGGVVAVLLGGVSLAQTAGGRVTVVLDGVNTSNGEMVVSLCADPKGQFPGGCRAYAGQTKAAKGQTVVTIDGVKPGSYALQAWHDENGDGRTQIPPEGYAYGNNVTWPPAFDKASITVAGDTTARLSMIYMVSGAPTGPAQGSKGVAPPAGIARIDLRERGLYGELYVQEGAKALPAVIILGGSEGGLGASGIAPSLAKQGYAVLSLAYWAEQGLPQTLENIPLEYFDKGVAWLKARPEVAGRPIGVIGWSRGSEAALLLGSRNKDIRAVVAVAPSGIMWQGIDFSDFVKAEPAWTVGGKGLPYVQPTSGAYRPNAPMSPIFTLSLPEANRKPEAAIPVERTNGPILLISGGADALWPSQQMADRVIARLQGTKFTHSYQHLNYPDAGHAIFVGEPDGPMGRASAAPNPMMGGTTETNRKAWADNWPKTLAFLDKALKGGR